MSTTSPDAFRQALERPEQTLRNAGLSFTRARAAPLFARLVVGDATDEMAIVDLAVDWRLEPPFRLEVGPVFALSDAVGSMTNALQLASYRPSFEPPSAKPDRALARY